MAELSTTENTIVNAINSLEARPIAQLGSGRPIISTKAAVRRCAKAWQKAYDQELERRYELALARNGGEHPSNPLSQFADSSSLNDAYGDALTVIDRTIALKNASRAYCNAMPLLVGTAGIRNFLACVAHGILIGAIDKSQGGSLLYAAQVALSSTPRETRALKATVVAGQTPPPSTFKAAIAMESTTSN